MAECRFSQHQWSPGQSRSLDVDVATFSCASCGVGHEVTFDKRVPGQVTTALRIFPADGAHTISRDVIRWSVLSHEANLSDIRGTGIRVIDEPVTIDGTPIGN